MSRELNIKYGVGLGVKTEDVYVFVIEIHINNIGLQSLSDNHCLSKSVADPR